jgi:hypothetical protein
MPFIAVLELTPDATTDLWTVRDWTLHDATPGTRKTERLMTLLEPVPDPVGGAQGAGLIPDLPTDVYDAGRDLSDRLNQRTWGASGFIVDSIRIRLNLQTLDAPERGEWRTHTNMTVTRRILEDFEGASSEQLMSGTWRVKVPSLLPASIEGHVEDASQRGVQRDERCQVLMFLHTAEDLL